MFTFYTVFISVFYICFSHSLINSERLQQLRVNFPKNLTSSYFNFQTKSYPFKLKTLTELSKNGTEKIKFPTRGYKRKKNFLQKQLLDFKNDAQLINCIHTIIENKTGNTSILDQLTTEPDRNLHTDMISIPYRNTTVHTMKDLIRNHIIADQTKTMTENENAKPVNHSEILPDRLIPLNVPSSRAVNRAELRLVRPNVNYVGNNIGAVKSLFNYNERKKSSIQQFPNISVARRYKPITNNQIQFYIKNEHGNRFDAANGEISTKINIEKNVKNNTVKEIMIIEIPIKSPMLQDKNILVNLNEIRDMTSESQGVDKSPPGASIQKVSFRGSEEIRSLKEVEKDIGKKVETNIVKYLDEFKRDMFTNLSKLIGQKYEDDPMKMSTSSNLQKKLKDFNYLSDQRGKHQIIYDQTPRNMFPFTKDAVNDQDLYKMKYNNALKTEEAMGEYLREEFNKTQSKLKNIPTNIKLNRIVFEKTEEKGKCIHFHSSTQATCGRHIRNKYTTSCSSSTEECTYSINTDEVEQYKGSTTPEIKYDTDSFKAEMKQCTGDITNGENNTDTEKEMDNQLITLYDVKQSNTNDSKLKDIIALYDIDLQHPKQLFLAPKGFLSNVTFSISSINLSVDTISSNPSDSTSSNPLELSNELDMEPETQSDHAINLLTNNNKTMLHSKCCKPNDRFKEVEAKCVDHNMNATLPSKIILQKDTLSPSSKHRIYSTNFTELYSSCHCGAQTSPKILPL